MSENTVVSDPGSSHDTGSWKLGFILLGGGVAWTLHFLLAWAIAEFGCIAGWDAAVFLGLHAITWLILGVTLGAVTLAAVAAGYAWQGVVAWRAGRAGAEQATAGLPDPRGWRSYVARAGLISNLTFLFIIVVETIPVFYFLGSC